MVGRIRRSALGLLVTTFVFLAFVSGAYCKGDPNEPNDELGDATAINTSGAFGGITSPAGDVDFYKFEIKSPGILEVKLNAVPDEMRTRIDFYGKNFNWITRKDASNPGDLVTLNLDISSPGWYYVGILDLEGRSHNVSYFFRAEFEPVVDDNEPNSEIGDATEISFGDLAQGYIFPRADGDFYKFNVSSPGILEVKLTDSPDDMKTRIDLYGKNYNWITRVDASNPGDLVTLNIDIADPSWYRVGIVDLEGRSHNVRYAFSVNFEPVVDGNEPNSEIGDAAEMSFGDPVSGIIFPRGDADFYKLWADIGKLEVKLTDSPDDMKTRIDLYGKNFNWITRVDASNPGDLATLEFEVADPGWYYIGISDLEGKSHNLGYSFTARGVGATKSDIGIMKNGTVGTKTGEVQTISDGVAGGKMTYPEATLTHSGFDFSEGATGVYPTLDGEIIAWQPGPAAHPDYPRDSDYLWWRNTHLDNVNFSSQTKDMGAVDIATVRNVPSEWDKSPLIPPLLLGHTIVAKCYDGYVKFQVISVDSADWSAVVRYSYSADAVFDDPAS